MPITVVDLATGADLAIAEDAFDPEFHRLKPGQHVAVDPGAISGAEGEAAALELTEEEIRRQSFDRISADRELEITRAAVRKERHGGLTNTLLEGVRGVGAGLTQNLSELALAGTTRLEREEQRDRRAENATAFAVGELAGGVGGALLPGSQARFLVGLGRLSPAARLSAISGQIAARGTKPLSRVGAQALGGAVEGAATGVGSFLAREALEEDPEFSASAIVSAAGIGGLLGGGIGGGIGLAGEATRAVRSRLARRLAGDVDEIDPAAFAALDQPALSGRGLTFEEVVSKRSQQRTGEALGDLATHIDDQGTRAFTAQGDDLARLGSRLDDLPIPPQVRQEVVDATQSAATRHQAAANSAQEWLRDAGEHLGDINLATASPDVLARALPDELEDRGALVLAQLDETGAELTALERSVGSAIDEGNTIAAQAAGGDAAATTGIRDRVGQLFRGRLGGVRQAAETTLGAAEFAREAGVDVGIPSVGDIPVVGDALSIWVRFRAGANALRKTGVLPATAQTRAASAVNNTRSQVARAVAKVAVSATTRRIGRRTPVVVASQIADLRSQTPEMIAERATAVTRGVPTLAPAAIGATVRARDYLVEHAPKSPYQDAPFAVSWAPTEEQRHLWQRRVDAVANPVGAVTSTMREPYPDLEAEVLREVYPAIYEAARTNLRDEINRLRKKLPEHRLLALGRAYRLPMSISQLPGYPTAQTSQQLQPPPQATDIARGPGPTTSPSVTTELTADQARARGQV